MRKISVPVSNHFCPQTLFLYGTYRDDRTANFGLFCWFSYCWDGALSVMACIGEDKLTRDRVRQTGMFSANLVTRPLLPFADFCGNHSGYGADKSTLAVQTVRGDALNVPVLCDSPWSYELSVSKTLPLDGGGELYVCRIENVLADERLADERSDVSERMRLCEPVTTTHATYFGFGGERLGAWSDWKEWKSYESPR